MFNCLENRNFSILTQGPPNTEQSMNDTERFEAHSPNPGHSQTDIHCPDRLKS